MRLAALYDIHANLAALETVLAEVRRERVDRLIIGGDVLPGPMPRETLNLLLALDIPVQFIVGNGDRVVLAQMRGIESDEVPREFRDIILWNAQQLDPHHAEVIATWPLTTTIEIRGFGEVLFCHATPRNDADIFTSLTPENRVMSLFGDITAAVVVCGHTHIQFDRMIGRTRVVNAGSVGMPFQVPGAYWLLLGPSIELRRTPYDLAAAADQIRATRYPRADEFAERNVLHPPSQAEMLETFTNISLS